MDEDRLITLEQFASELTGMHTMTVRVEHGDLVIDDGGDEMYVVRALPSGPGGEGPLGAGLRVYMRANEAGCSARGCHNCGHGHLGGWEEYRHWPCLTCRIGSGLCCGDDNWTPNNPTVNKEAR